jgi:hypothetical protein
MMRFVKLSVVMLNVIMLSVVAPRQLTERVNFYRSLVNLVGKF